MRQLYSTTNQKFSNSATLGINWLEVASEELWATTTLDIDLIGH